MLDSIQFNSFTFYFILTNSIFQEVHREIDFKHVKSQTAVVIFQQEEKSEEKWKKNEKLKTKTNVDQVLSFYFRSHLFLSLPNHPPQILSSQNSSFLLPHLQFFTNHQFFTIHQSFLHHFLFFPSFQLFSNEMKEKIF